MTQCEIVEVQENTDAYRDLLDVAVRIDQSRYVPNKETHIQESILFGAFLGDQCVGFLRFTIQIIGSDEGRPRSSMMVNHCGKGM